MCFCIRLATQSEPLLYEAAHTLSPAGLRQWHDDSAAAWLQHRPQLLPVATSGSGSEDAYLALSFDAAGYTTLLDVRGSSVREVRPPGLVLEQPSLLLARLPDGRLLQVTPEVRSPLQMATSFIRFLDE